MTRKWKSTFFYRLFLGVFRVFRGQNSGVLFWLLFRNFRRQRRAEKCQEKMCQKNVAIQSDTAYPPPVLKSSQLNAFDWLFGVGRIGWAGMDCCFHLAKRGRGQRDWDFDLKRNLPCRFSVSVSSRREGAFCLLFASAFHRIPL